MAFTYVGRRSLAAIKAATLVTTTSRTVSTTAAVLESVVPTDFISKFLATADPRHATIMMSIHTAHHGRQMTQRSLLTSPLISNELRHEFFGAYAKVSYSNSEWGLGPYTPIRTPTERKVWRDALVSEIAKTSFGTDMIGVIGIAGVGAAILSVVGIGLTIYSFSLPLHGPYPLLLSIGNSLFTPYTLVWAGVPLAGIVVLSAQHRRDLRRVLNDLYVGDFASAFQRNDIHMSHSVDPTVTALMNLYCQQLK